MAEDEVLLVTMRVEDNDDPVPGCTRGHFCATCGAECWVSPSSQGKVDLGAVICCYRCAEKTMSPDDPFIPPDDEQMKEIASRARELGLPVPTREEIMTSVRQHIARIRSMN